MNEHLARVGISLKPGAVEILEVLKERKIASAVATASDMIRTEKYLDEVGIKKLFYKADKCSNGEGRKTFTGYLSLCM